MGDASRKRQQSLAANMKFGLQPLNDLVDLQQFATRRGGTDLSRLIRSSALAGC
jgi:hypothetical protein